jgi:hypothetical protein
MSKTQRNFVRIENLTERPIELPALPATATSPAYDAVVLKIGGTNVRADYLAAMVSFEVTNRFGQPHKPHAELLTKLKAKKPRYPQGEIRIDEDPDAWRRPEGLIVEDLAELEEPAAIDAVLSEFSKEKLDQWDVTERRSKVKEAIAFRIAKIA